ncbi:hypothetical protein GEMRC1_001005 [Eukaryota sp. GEM-RC1]
MFTANARMILLNIVKQEIMMLDQHGDPPRSFKKEEVLCHSQAVLHFYYSTFLPHLEKSEFSSEAPFTTNYLDINNVASSAATDDVVPFLCVLIP